MAETAKCPTHGIEFPVGKGSDGCERCAAYLADPRPVEQMSAEERIAEIERWMLMLTVPFGDMWPRLDALVGRDTYNHEWADPDSIYAEMRGEGREGPVEKLQRLMPGKPVVTIDPKGKSEEQVAEEVTRGLSSEKGDT
jgi:hypothetical protein